MPTRDPVVSPGPPLGLIPVLGAPPTRGCPVANLSLLDSQGPGQVSSVIPDSSPGAICIMALNHLVEATGSFHKPKAHI